MSGFEIVKMSGSGNDFVVLDGVGRERLGADVGAWVRRICRRGLSVGADGVLFVRPLGESAVEVEFRNPDGSLAFCANGTRCAARFAFRRGMAPRRMTLETAAGTIPAVVDEHAVRLELPVPVDSGTREVAVGDERVRGRLVDAGVPHFVIDDVDLPEGTLGRWGPVVRRAPVFGAQGTNVDLARRTGRRELSVRTWERGVEGETLSCGSGAVASAFVAWLGGIGRSVRVVPPSGVPLEIEFDDAVGELRAVRLSGDARTVFVGQVDDESVSGFDAG
ncbi:MAG TPA: diaminopimelate epimerase [Candidatus Polarisedimenticolaceae bacterium]|nr:diaminopimelate epimerase [Candidatus Polarisedimenticolaceae bacterium]